MIPKTNTIAVGERMGYDAGIPPSGTDEPLPGPALSHGAGPSLSDAARVMDMSELRIRQARRALQRPPVDKDTALRGALADIGVIMTMVAQAQPVEDIFAEVQEAKRRIREALGE